MRYLVAEIIGVVRSEGLRPFRELGSGVSDLFPETCRRGRRPVSLRSVRLVAAVELALIGTDCFRGVAYGVSPCWELLGVLGQGSIVQLLRLGQLYKDDIRELRGLCLRQGAQVRLSRVELSGVVEVVGLNLWR